jgi:hypothetical protein
LAIVTILADKTSVRAKIESTRRTFRDMKTTPEGREGRNGVRLDIVSQVEMRAKKRAGSGQRRRVEERVKTV